MVMLEVKLHQLVLNLCINARDALNGAGEIRVSLGRSFIRSQVCESCGQQVDGEYAVLAVRDTGAGMDAAVIQRMFGAFYTTKPVSRGTGMGLSVVHGIEQEHGGHLRVEIALGKGTCFALFLPISTQSPKLGVADEGLERTEFLSDARDRLSWVVDDVGQICGFLETLFLSRRYRVRAFTSSLDALRALEGDSIQPDLVIIDQTMPDILGLELASAIRAKREHLPIISCTGFHDKLAAAGVKDLAIDHFFRKPLDSAALCAAVRELLDPAV